MTFVGKIKLFLFAFVQLLFVGLLWVNSHGVLIWLIIPLILSVTFIFLEQKSVNINIKFFSIILFSFIGFYATVFLAQYVNAVLACALSTLILSFTRLAKENQLFVLYTASFSGMSSFIDLWNPLFIGLPILIAVIFYLLKDILLGIGGKLGTIGFCGALIYYGLC